MGREIVYCSQCGVRILEKDLATGRAFTVLDKVFCVECRDQAFEQANLPAPAAKTAAGKPAARPAASKPVSEAPRAPVQGVRPPVREGVSAPHAPRTIVRRPNRTPLYMACAVGMVGLFVLIIVIISSGSDPEKPKERTAESVAAAKERELQKLTPEERAARRLAELQQAATPAAVPADLLKKIAEAEKDILGTPSDEEYRKLKKRWERKLEEAEVGVKIDALMSQARTGAAADPDFKRHAGIRDLLQKAEELAVSIGSEKLADVKNLRTEIEGPYEARADEWFEKKEPAIRQWMNEGEFKGGLKLIDGFPEDLRLSKVWRVYLTRMREDCEKGIAAQAAKAAGKEREKDWKEHLRIGLDHVGMKNWAKARESLLKSEAGIPAADKLNDQEKKAVAWHVYYNLGCVFAEESKKLEGAEKAASVDSAFEYLRKSAEAGVFEWPCGESDHPKTQDHWDKDKDLETIRGDARYAELIRKFAK